MSQHVPNGAPIAERPSGGRAPYPPQAWCFSFDRHVCILHGARECPRMEAKFSALHEAVDVTASRPPSGAPRATTDRRPPLRRRGGTLAPRNGATRARAASRLAEAHVALCATQDVTACAPARKSTPPTCDRACEPRSGPPPELDLEGLVCGLRVRSASRRRARGTREAPPRAAHKTRSRPTGSTHHATATHEAPRAPERPPLSSRDKRWPSRALLIARPYQGRSRASLSKWRGSRSAQ